jgi:predicted nuclease with TOPRIM domain
MEPENLTVRVLMDIRDEMRGMRADLVEVKGELVEMKDELVNVNARLATVETTLRDTNEHVRFIGRSMGVLRVGRHRHEKRLDDLERRVGDLERGR